MSLGEKLKNKSWFVNLLCFSHPFIQVCSQPALIYLLYFLLVLLSHIPELLLNTVSCENPLPAIT